MPERVKKMSLYEQISDQIIHLIDTNEWPVGSQLPNELLLAEEFGVSRNCVREALKSLELYGILFSHPGRGTFVSTEAHSHIENMKFIDSISGGSFRELIEARIATECHLARLAAEWGSDEEKDELERVFNLLKNDLPQNHDEIRPSPVQSGYAFHDAIAHMAHNDLLYQFLQKLNVEIDKHRRNLKLDAKDTDTMIADHYLIYQAIREGNAERAREAMETHIANTYRVFISH